MVHHGPVLAKYLFDPLELLACDPGRDLSLVALAFLENVYRHEQGIFVDPIKSGPLHVVGAVQGHFEVSTKSIFVKGNRIRSGSPPWIIPDLVVTKCGVDLEIMVLEALDPSGIIFIRPLVDFLLLRSPVPHHEVARDHGEGRVFPFHGTDDEPEGVFPTFLRVLDVEVEKVGNADEGPRFCFLGK